MFSFPDLEPPAFLPCVSTHCVGRKRCSTHYQEACQRSDWKRVTFLWPFSLVSNAKVMDSQACSTLTHTKASEQMVTLYSMSKCFGKLKLFWEYTVDQGLLTVECVSNVNQAQCFCKLYRELGKKKWSRTNQHTQNFSDFSFLNHCSFYCNILLLFILYNRMSLCVWNEGRSSDHF